MKKEFVTNNFNRHAREYDEHSRLQRRVASELLTRAKQFYGKIVDLGAGTGFIKQHTDWDLTEVDISPEMCAILGADAVCADIENLPFADNTFDNAISSLTVQWMVNPDKGYEEIYRVLKKGGKFCFSTFTAGSLRELKASFAEMDNDKHILEFDPAMLVFGRLKKAGFSGIVVNQQKITYRHKNIFELMRSIKNIGASYSGERAKKGLHGKKYFTKLDSIYRSKFTDNDMLTASWEVLYITAEKK